MKADELSKEKAGIWGVWVYFCENGGVGVSTVLLLLCIFFHIK